MRGARLLPALVLTIILAACGSSTTPTPQATESARATPAATSAATALPSEAAVETMTGEAAQYVEYLSAGANCDEAVATADGFEVVCETSAGSIEDTITVSLTSTRLVEVRYESTDTSGGAFASMPTGDFAGRIIGSVDPLFGDEAERLFQSFASSVDMDLMGTGTSIKEPTTGASIEFTAAPADADAENYRVFTIRPGPDGIPD